MRSLLADAARRHDDVQRAVRLAASSPDDRAVMLREAVDRDLRTRRYLDYYESSSWALEAAPIVDALGDEVGAAPSAALVLLLERAAGHLVKVILRADDSDGMIGDLAQRVLELHGRACDAQVADPQRLVKWMIKFGFDDQDFFFIDPVRYADALGASGLAVFRAEVARRAAADPSSFVALHSLERLAVLDGDVERIVELLGGDLTAPHQFIRVAEAMAELGRDDDVLQWTARGIASTHGWQVAKLFDLACEVHERRVDFRSVLDLRRQQHELMPSSSTYAHLRAAAQRLGGWDSERGLARKVLGDRDPAGLIDAALDDGDVDAAWVTAHGDDCDPGTKQWLRLAKAREPQAPADALAVYLRAADSTLEETSKRAYQEAIRILKAAKRAAALAGEESIFTTRLGELREDHRRRPSLIALLDKAKLV